MSGVVKADYNEILKCPMDTLSREDGKTLSPHGVVCKARLELFPIDDAANPSSPYTGILAPGTKWDHCLLRLSSAMQPPDQAIKSTWARTILYTTGEKIRTAQLFPCSALKVFPNESSTSRNVLFGGSKVGQRETDFFAHCQCTSMTERMPSAVKPFVRKFWEYSKWPLSLGISDFCKPLHRQDDEADEINFPFALILKPRIRSEPASPDPVEANDDGGSADEADGLSGASSGKRKTFSWSSSMSFGSRRDSSSASFGSEVNSFDSFLDFSLNNVPAETHLFDVYACPNPNDVADASKLQRIGKIVTTSTFIQSTPDDGLFFKHQAKEEDYALRPDWPEALAQPVTLDKGNVKGTIGTLVGWKLFEQQIAKGEYMDFETEETKAE